MRSKIGAAQPHDRERFGSDGFAVVDALVALTILTLTIGLSLAAIAQGTRVTSEATEVRLATGVLQRLVDESNTPHASGQGQGFDWRHTVGAPQSDALAPRVATCHRSAALMALRSRRRYALSTTVACEPVAIR